jgi:sirohydrochlorin ferrochelatase
VKLSNKEAVILLGHGSRVPGAGEGMERIAARMRERLDGEIVEICYMSKQGPSFAEALARCVARGAGKVIVIPYFLHTGLHILEDIPDILREKAKEFPGVEIILGKNLGFDECLVDLVLKRLEESRTLPDVGKIMSVSLEEVK